MKINNTIALRLRAMNQSGGCCTLDMGKWLVNQSYWFNFTYFHREKLLPDCVIVQSKSTNKQTKKRSCIAQPQLKFVNRLYL